MTSTVTGVPGEYLTSAEAAELAGIKVESLRRMLVRGTFPPPDGKFGSANYWHPSTVLEWRETRRPPGRPKKTAGE